MSPPKIGLALSGGAARGMAHVGVLRALLENGIPIDCVAGTSAGSIVGGAFAAGMTIDEIAELGRKLRWRHIGRITMSRFGLQSNARLERFMRARLPITKFEDLPIPFAVVATDLKTGEAVVMKDKGDVPFAIRASCTIPGWYVPVPDSEGRQLVDGGLVAVIPAAAARALGADVVIAVDVNGAGATFMSSTSSVVGVLLQSMMVIQRSVSRQHCEISDLVITPKVGHIRWDQVRRADELMVAGYEAGLESIPQIRRLIRSDQFFKSELSAVPEFDLH
ncbi:MAG TPA: patatin-like phospholipase family protein [Pyrinomonadaceae bacterium]|nr:patatin-like phospholipase family protein [Pyrinomonadaceae bacterium]